MTHFPWLPEIRAVAHDVQVAARGRPRDLAAVAVTVPPEVDPRIIANVLAEVLQHNGMANVTVSTVVAPGPVTILTLEFNR